MSRPRPKLHTTWRATASSFALYAIFATGAVLTSGEVFAQAKVKPSGENKPIPLEPLIVVGPIYEISEPDLLKQITAKLEADQASGRLRADMEKAIARSRSSMDTPPSNNALSTTTTPRTIYYDPTIVASKDVRDLSGAYVVKAGQQVNPLSVAAWPQPWIFLDAREPAQVRYAQRWLAFSKTPAKIVLTGGVPRDAAIAFNQAVFFDQGSYFVNRFGITQVPAILTQDGLVLKIQEVKP